MSAVWNHKSVGCYAHSEFGYQHVRNTLSNLLALTYGESQAPLIRLLRNRPWDEDDGEVLRAMELLNDKCVGARWAMVDGDLCLIEQKVG
jgi:hypothetical protein